MSRMIAGLTKKVWLKRMVNAVGRKLQTYAPRVYDRVFLPMKIRAKQAVLGSFRNRASGGCEGSILWHSPGQGSLGEKLVSVIVPCYNHAEYLRERLDSIYGQTYGKMEVILLDDASDDGSQEILREYQQRYPGQTRLFLNESNGGAVFRQWEKGMELARGEILWIAESDDCCDRDFLEKLLPAFRDDAVMLAFCRSEFVQDGRAVNATEMYLGEFARFDWQSSFFVTAHDLVREAFSIMNVIPNVSSALMRKPVELSGEVRSLWQDLRLCGDWVFYLDIIRGGCVYYSHETTNYYRIHGKSTSLNIQQQSRYYREHEQVACYLARHYRLPKEIHEHHLALLEEHYRAFFQGEETGGAASHFRLDRIYEEAATRKPAVLMAVYAMSVGGGETFPIVLANELKRQGVSVALMDFRMGEEMEGIRSMLRPDVPCIPLQDVGEMADRVQQLGMDVIHSHHGTVDEAVSYVMEAMPGVHHVVTLHGMYEAKEKAYRESMIRRVFPECSAFVYIADKNLVPFREMGIQDFGKFRKIGNGLPYTEGIPISRREMEIPEDAFVLCLVSRALPEKGWQAAVDAVAMARKEGGQEIHLLLVGCGEMYDKMKGKVPPYVHLMGFRSNVRDFFATADAGILPSEYKGESFPLTVIDCLYCGRPIIATDIGEVRNQLMTPEGEPAGILLSLQDGRVAVRELAEAVRALAGSPEKYEELKSRCRAAAEKFRMEHVAEKYMKVYQEAGSSRPAFLQGEETGEHGSSISDGRKGNP